MKVARLTKVSLLTVVRVRIGISPLYQLPGKRLFELHQSVAPQGCI